MRSFIMTNRHSTLLESVAPCFRRARAWLALLLAAAALCVLSRPVLAEGMKDGVTATNPADPKRLLIVGSSTTAPLIQELAKLFMERHPDVTIVVETGGSARGVKATLAGEADIGMVSRPLKAEEKALFVIPIARDGTALVVNKANPVNALSREQVRDIYLGRIADWKTLGGPARPIELLRREKGQGVTAILDHYLGFKAEEYRQSVEVVLNDAVVKAVSSNPSVLSILSVGVAKEAMEKGLPLKMLALDGVQPGTETIRNGSWPMARALTLVTRSVPSGLAQEFIQFALSPAARPLIQEQDFIAF